MNEDTSRRVRFSDLCDAVADRRRLDEVLPRDVFAALADAPQPRVLTDFAGRDSVAAAIAWLRAEGPATLIPVADVVPTRFGDWRIYDDNWARLRDQVSRVSAGTRLVPWFCLEDVEFWRLLNARFMNELSRRFGFFSPCLGCHLHFYAMRGVLADALEAKVLISGEKELHRGGRRKANQTNEAVDAYLQFSRSQGIDHRFPIHRVEREAELLELLGDGWREGDRQLSCAMSGNDTGADGRPLFEPSQIEEYMKLFASPVAARIVELRRRGVSGVELSSAVEGYAAELLRAPSP